MSFPDSVEEISFFTSGAASVKFPNSLKTLGRINFPNITSVEFPSSVTEMFGTLKFNKVKEITIPGSVKNFRAGFASCSKLVTGDLETITFSEGVETIEDGQGNFLDKNNKVKTINFPDSFKAINKSSLFRNGKNLETINWPDHEITVKDNYGMFAGCVKLTKLDLPAWFTPDGKVGATMFMGCTNLKEINFGCKLTNIGSSAFSGCKSLEKSPDLSQVGTMGYKAFSGCEKMTGDLEGGGIDLSSLDTVPNFAFKDSMITNVKFSNGLSSIGKGAFQNTKVQDIVIPDSAESIGQEAFSGAKSLTSLKIGDGVETLDNSAFSDCTGLKEIEIGSGISKIDDTAFNGCTAVEKATIHTSEDAVEVGDIGSLPHEKIKFTEESLGDAGDTISEGGPTLQEAVNNADDGGTVVIKKHVLLDKTLTVPENKTVTIKSEDNKYIIRAGKNASLSSGKLIEVGEGRTLKLEDVTVQGLFAGVGEGSGLIDVGGKLVLGSNALIKDTYLSNNNSSAIRVSGKDAGLEMDDGSIVSHNKRNSGKAEKTASIRVTDGAVFNMNGGSITGNSAVDSGKQEAVFCSSGVYLDKNAKMNMLGGTISNNKGHRGSAITADGAELVIDGEDALIENNTVVSNNAMPSYCGGAVFAYSTFDKNGSVTLKNGTLRNNTASNVGGAIAIGRDADFSMEGGVVEKNHASGYGGGIYLYGDELRLTAGKISNNSCGVAGGGVYVEGNLDQGYSTAHFSNAVIRDNTATTGKYDRQAMGGGVWACPTGRVSMQDNSAAVYDNHATASDGRDAAGDDFAIIPPKHDNVFHENVTPDPYRTNLAGNSFGGGQLHYYRDGSVYASFLVNTETRDLGGVGGGARYDAENATEFSGDGAGGCSLKTVADSRVKALGSSAKLQITGNTANRGAGIGSNGGVVFEGGGSKKINIEKKWSGKDPEVDSVTVGIYGSDGSTKIDTVTLRKEDGWKAEITGLPEYITAADLTVVEETSLENYDAAVTVTDGEDGVSINIVVTNTYSEPPLTPDTPEPQNPTPDNPNPDNPVKVTTDNPQSGVPTGDTFPAAVSIAAVCAVIAALIAAYMRRREAEK